MDAEWEKQTSKVLGAGADDFIGRTVCDQLAASGTRILTTYFMPDAESYRSLTLCDLADVHGLHSMTEGQNIGGIIHCGAVSGPMLARDNSWALIQVNMTNTANVLELARVRCNKRMVFVSFTAGFRQAPSSRVSEEAVSRLSTLCNASNLVSETQAATYALQFRLDTVSQRLSWV